jgi:hypothetical protein
MSATITSRLIAGVLLAVGGFLIAVTAIAVAMAAVLVDAGVPARPADAALLSDLVAILPLVVAFAAANLLAAIGLALGRAWGDAYAIIVAATGLTVGAVGLLLVIVGQDPFASTASRATEADGVGIIGAFTLLYLSSLVALFAARGPQPIRQSSGAFA